MDNIKLCSSNDGDNNNSTSNQQWENAENGTKQK